MEILKDLQVNSMSFCAECMQILSDIYKARNQFQALTSINSLLYPFLVRIAKDKLLLAVDEKSTPANVLKSEASLIKIKKSESEEESVQGTEQDFVLEADCRSEESQEESSSSPVKEENFDSEPEEDNFDSEPEEENFDSEPEEEEFYMEIKKVKMEINEEIDSKTKVERIEPSKVTTFLESNIRTAGTMPQQQQQQPNYNCQKCGAKCASKSRLARHIHKSRGACKIRISLPLKYWTCNLCGDPNITSGNKVTHFTKHRGTIDLENPLICCGKNFKIEHSLWLHQALVHFTNPLKPKQPQKKKELKKKLRIANAKKYECSICGKVYITKGGKSTFRLHMETEHGQPPLCPCNICGKPCQGSKDLKRHIHTHLGKDEKAEAKINSEQIHFEKCLCSECGALYSEKATLERHIKAVHINNTSWRPKYHQICAKCGKEYLTRASYKKHCKEHEFAESGFYRFCCQLCSKKFNSKAEFILHPPECPSEIHLRPFECVEKDCKRRFKLKHQLELHLHEFHKYISEKARGIVYPGLGPRRVPIGQELKRLQLAKRKKKDD